MVLPSVPEWSFDNIRAQDPDRAAKLEGYPAPDRVVEALTKSLSDSIESQTVRFGIDSLDADFLSRRAIVQFSISFDLFDWFFNGRTGYRAQYWVSPQDGLCFNNDLVKRLIAQLYAKKITGTLAPVVTARLIQTEWIKLPNGEKQRVDTDVGTEVIGTEFILKSLSSSDSKIWICEKLLQPDIGQIKDLSLTLFSAAERYLPKLVVRRWEGAAHPKTGQIGEGLRAPIPDSDEGWIDLKGAFVLQDDCFKQLKSSSCRSAALYSCGWT